MLHHNDEDTNLILTPEDDGLPLIYLGGSDIPFTPDEMDIIKNLREFPPRTNLGRGDLVMLKHLPTKQWLDFTKVPRVWQVRFVVSAYQFHMHSIVHEDPSVGLDQAVAMLEQNLHHHRYEQPMVYCHAFPHGHYPNTAQWFPEHALRQIVLRAPNENWELLLDEFQTPFYGFDTDYLRGRFVFDMAPDLYGRAKNNNKPLRPEEETFHSACLLGLEEIMMKPVEPKAPKTIKRIDPEHPVFQVKTPSKTPVIF